MATVESLNTAFTRQTATAGANGLPRPRPRAPEEQALKAAMPGEGSSLPAQEAQKIVLPHPEGNPPETGSGNEAAKPREQMSLAELAEVLHKVNLTFDLFEIRANYTVNSNTGEVVVQIINQRTGELIRRIPPYDLPKIAEAISNQQPSGLGGSILTDVMA